MVKKQTVALKDAARDAKTPTEWLETAERALVRSLGKGVENSDRAVRKALFLSKLTRLERYLSGVNRTLRTLIDSNADCPGGPAWLRDLGFEASLVKNCTAAAKPYTGQLEFGDTDSENIVRCLNDMRLLLVEMRPRIPPPRPRAAPIAPPHHHG